MAFSAAWYARFPVRLSAGVIALGCFVSPARLVNGCEDTAERVLGNGSSAGARSASNTEGVEVQAD